MPVSSVTQDATKLTLIVVGDFPVSQQRLWEAYTDPRQLERFWGPPDFPTTFTMHDFRIGGRAEYFMTGPKGEKWNGSWRFTLINPIGFFAAVDGDGNVDDPNMPAGMTFTFETTPAGSRITCVTQFESLEAMEAMASAMEDGMRAAMPQLDALLAERSTSAAHA